MATKFSFVENLGIGCSLIGVAFFTNHMINKVYSASKLGAPKWVYQLDVNEDGKDDIVVSNNGGYHVFLGRGDGTYVPLDQTNFGSNEIQRVQEKVDKKFRFD